MGMNHGAQMAARLLADFRRGRLVEIHSRTVCQIHRMSPSPPLGAAYPAGPNSPFSNV
jgi:hypothetical protein